MATKSVKKKTVKKKAAPKKKPAKTVKKTKVDEPSLKIIQTSKCQTISGKSTLTYNVGVNDEGNMHIRVFSNTGGGFFSNEWVLIDDITSLLGDVNGEHITSINLIPLFKGKSVNTPGYLIAVLLNEKLLRPFEDKKRQFIYTGAKTLSTKATKRKKAR